MFSPAPACILRLAAEFGLSGFDDVQTFASVTMAVAVCAIYVALTPSTTKAVCFKDAVGLIDGKSISGRILILHFLLCSFISMVGMLRLGLIRSSLAED